MTPETVFDGVPAEAKVILGYACGVPLTAVAALAAHTTRVPGATLHAGLVVGDDLPIGDAVRSGSLRLRSWHISGPVRRWWREGLVEYVPLRMSDVARVLTRDMDVGNPARHPPPRSAPVGPGVPPRKERRHDQ
jgi:hypothetical protein